MKVIVTGGSGYFGTLLLEKLLSLGHECLNIDVNPTDIVAENLTTKLCDIRDLESLNESISKADVVFHNVAQVPLAKNAYEFDTVNRVGTENILRVAVKKKISNVVYTSSSAVYGIPTKNPVQNDDLARPREAYGMAKLEGEKICRHYYDKYGLNISIIRPRTIMGPGRLGIFSILFDWISRGYNVPVFNGGNNIYQFIHSDDLADACISSSSRVGFSSYNIGAEQFGSMREVLSSLCTHAGTGSKVVSLPMKPMVVGMKIASKLKISPLGDYHALMYGRSMFFDTSKAKAELNWRAKYSNDEMFIETYDWYLKNSASLKKATTKSQHKSVTRQKILSIVGRCL